MFLNLTEEENFEFLSGLSKRMDEYKTIEVVDAQGIEKYWDDFKKWKDEVKVEQKLNRKVDPKDKGQNSESQNKDNDTDKTETEENKTYEESRIENMKFEEGKVLQEKKKDFLEETVESHGSETIDKK